EAGLGAGPHGAAQGVGLERQRAESDPTRRVPPHLDLPPGEHEILLRCFELVTGEVEDFLAHARGGRVTRTPSPDGAPTRERAGAPGKLPGVTRDDAHVR